MTTVAEQVAARRASRVPRPAGEQPTPFEAEQARLALSGLPDGVLAVGSTLTDIEVLDVDGKPTTLFASLGDQTAVVLLDRGKWCPFCSNAVRSYQAELVPVFDHSALSSWP